MLKKADFRPLGANDYPTSDGRIMPETDWHRILMVALIETLTDWYAADPDVYVSGNMLVFYEQGNKRRHLSPDCFVVKGVPKRLRPNYLMWEEGKGPDVVIEITSKTTRTADTKKKLELYRDKLGVAEYFLFDPKEDYLTPSMQGFRRANDVFQPVELVERRLPSEILGLHLERDGEALRLWDPKTRTRLPTTAESKSHSEAARRRAEAAQQRAEAAQQRAEEEVARLRRELEALRGRPGNT